MSRSATLAHISAGLLVAATFASTAAMAQRTPTETVPGGVEMRPAIPSAPATRSPPAPVPAAPIVGSPSPGAASGGSAPSLERAQPPADKPAPPPAKVPKGKKTGAKKAPVPLTQSLAPGVNPSVNPSVSPATPANDESKPGAVERAPGAPKQPQQ